MIKTKADLKDFIKYEKKKYPLSGSHGVYRFLVQDEIYIIWKFQLLLRKCEFYKNTNKKLRYLFTLRKLNKYRNYYGIHIPLNVFDKGLKIAHLGSILVNGKAKVGKDCSIHINTAIVAKGNTDGVPIIGDNCVIGVGSVILGDIKISDGIAIGANSLVNKSFEEDDITIAGIPAKKISDSGRETWNNSINTTIDIKS